jgi:2-amino-4-hydroxy-6-hydroxymethyldihydropteridine diphosphokinase
VPRAYVGLGSNLGDRESILRRAVELLGAAEGIEVVAVSAFRETDPVGVPDQPRFLNGAVEVETTLAPRGLLETLLGVERSLGRVRDGRRWGPRVVDLDLLVYEGHVVDEPGLRIPHPHVHERWFALEPLSDLDPALEIPGHGSVTSLIAALD